MRIYKKLITPKYLKTHVSYLTVNLTVFRKWQIFDRLFSEIAIDYYSLWVLRLFIALPNLPLCFALRYSQTIIEGFFSFSRMSVRICKILTLIFVIMTINHLWCTARWSGKLDRFIVEDYFIGTVFKGISTLPIRTVRCSQAPAVWFKRPTDHQINVIWIILMYCMHNHVRNCLTWFLGQSIHLQKKWQTKMLITSKRSDLKIIILLHFPI